MDFDEKFDDRSEAESSILGSLLEAFPAYVSCVHARAVL